MSKKRLLICSDIHGNLQALQAVLHKAQTLSIDGFICLGDVVGYGANPDECYRLLEEYGFLILKGNHEALLLHEASSKDCSQLGQQSAAWTDANVSEEVRYLYQALPYALFQPPLAFYHADATEDGRWIYQNTVEQVAQAWGDFSGEPIVFCGHTHRSRLTVLDAGIAVWDEYILHNKRICIALEVNAPKKYIINVGSVGQQRDTKTDAGFVVAEYDDQSVQVDFHRIPYNSLAAYREIKRSGCGAEVANYLIREAWRRELYGLFDYGRVRVCRKTIG